MISGRTKVIFWLTAFPMVSVGVGAVWAAVYLHSMPRNQATYFISVKIPWLRVLLASATIFACGLLSLFLDRRNTGRKYEK